MSSVAQSITIGEHKLFIPLHNEVVLHYSLLLPSEYSLRIYFRQHGQLNALYHISIAKGGSADIVLERINKHFPHFE